VGKNNLIEIGSKANVVLRFREPTTVAGVYYKPNEPYLFFKNANVLVEYSNEDKTGTAARTVIANSEINPRTITVGSINLTKKLISLLTCTSEDVENFGLTVFENGEVESDNGTLFIMPNNNILEGTESDIFVYSEDNFTRLPGITYNAAQNRIIQTDLETGDQEFELGKNYLVSYSSAYAGTKFSLEKNHVPYFSLEIQGIGNVDKSKKNIVMYFDKVSLNTSIDFTFIQDDLINVPLLFHIIENKNNYV
jgi:hypothetical protein